MGGVALPLLCLSRSCRPSFFGASEQGRFFLAHGFGYRSLAATQLRRAHPKNGCGKKDKAYPKKVLPNGINTSLLSVVVQRRCWSHERAKRRPHTAPFFSCAMCIAQGQLASHKRTILMNRRCRNQYVVIVASVLLPIFERVPPLAHPRKDA
nr:hypothetical protein [Pandoravirus massiliensis]